MPRALPRATTDVAQPRGRGDRRPRILDAAMGLFSALPYAEVHMDAVAKAARVAKPTLYRYFPTKEALFIEGLAWQLAALREEIGASGAGSPPPTAGERLRRAIAVILHRVGALSPALRAAEGQGGEIGAESRRTLRAGFRALRDAIGAILRDGARTGELAAVDVDLAVLVILGGVRMAAFAAPRGPVDPSDLADLLLGGLRAPARGHMLDHLDSPANERTGSRRSSLGAVA